MELLPEAIGLLLIKKIPGNQLSKLSPVNLCSSVSVNTVPCLHNFALNADLSRHPKNGFQKLFDLHSTSCAAQHTQKHTSPQMCIRGY